VARGSPVDARLDGRSFVKFHVDLGVGDAVLEPIDEIAGEDWLGFAGIAPSTREGRANTRDSGADMAHTPPCGQTVSGTQTRRASAVSVPTRLPQLAAVLV
jgi:hypothetical protein